MPAAATPSRLPLVAAAPIRPAPIRVRPDGRAHVVCRAMRGYGPTSYGDAFADVYDDWYGEVSDVDATVSTMVELAGPGGSVLELGAGTGRLAVPLAEAGLRVTGIDASAAMLDQLHRRDPAGRVAVHHGDMVADLPPGPFDAVLVAYNTIFNLPDERSQRTCFAAVAQRLGDGGCFVVEAFVPDTRPWAGSDVSVRSMSVDRVVLSLSRHDPEHQRAEGQFVELVDGGTVRLRPWSIRWTTVEQLDEYAGAAGLRVRARWADMARTPFDDDSTGHVTVYERMR